MKSLLYKVLMEHQSLGWIGVSLPEKISNEIKEWVKNHIPLETILEPEENPHVTLKYGIHTFCPKEVREAVSGYSRRGRKKICGMLGQITIFEHDNQDVLIIKVISPDIERINNFICKGLETTDTYREFKPHVTLAYLKKGAGDRYIGNRAFFNKKFTVEEIEFNDANKKRNVIKLC